MALLRALLKKMSANDDAPRSGAQQPPARCVPDSVEPLNALARERRLITVRHRNRSYQSLILAVDADRGLLWLDELFPRAVQLATGEALTVECHQGTEVIRLSAPLLGLRQSPTGECLALALPEHCYQGPRRQDPRLSVFGRYPISARLTLPGLPPLGGEVLNLSAGGLRLALSDDRRSALRPGDILPLCEFTVAPGLKVRCRVRVCAFNLSHKPWRQTRISLAFHDLAPATRLALGQFVESRLSPGRDAA